MKLSIKPKQFYFILLGLLVFSFAGGALAYYFSYTQLNSQSSLLRRTLADMQLSGDRIDQLSQLKAQYRALTPDLPLFARALPTAKNQSEIVQQLNQLASTNSMSLPGVSFAGDSATLPGPLTLTAKAGNMLAVPIAISLTGTYDQMQNFLQSLEKLGRYNSVTSLTINRTGVGNSLSFAITANVFFQP